MTWEEREAVIKEAAMRLKWLLEARPDPPLLPWRKTEWLEERRQAIMEYLRDVHAAYWAEMVRAEAPAEDVSERTRAEAFARAIEEAPSPEVKAVAEEFAARIAALWRAQYARVRAERSTPTASSPEKSTFVWRAERVEALRQWREIQAAEAASAPVIQGPTPTSGKPEQATAVYPNRAAWLKRVLHEKNLSARALSEMRHGPDQKTVGKILRGLPVSEKSLARLAQALKVSREQIPSD